MKRLRTPDWLQKAIGMKYFGVEIKDAYIAKEKNRPIGINDKNFEHINVVVLESGSLRRNIGYWYYHPHEKTYYWSNSTVKIVFKKAFDEIIKQNFDPEKSYS